MTMSGPPGASTSATPPVQLLLLGSMSMRVGDQPIDITAEKERTLVAVVALAGTEGISTVALIDELWEEPSARAKGTLQTYVSNIRKLLRSAGTGDAPVLERVGERYRFAPGTVRVDVVEFRTHLARVRSALAGADPDRDTALAQLLLALEHVRGPLDPSVVKGTGRLAADAARLHDEILEARWIWADLEIQAGRAASVVGELRAIVDEDPTEERFWRQLMLAYWKTGRQQMALDAYQQVRRVLGEELGVLPDPSLQDLESAILRHDPQLGRADESVPPVVDEAAPRRRTGNLLVTLNSFVGRDRELERVLALLLEHPLVSLRGAGGCGKTRLAIEAARSVQERFDGGAWWVELGEVAADHESARSSVVDSIATAVGLIRRSQGSLDEALVDHLDHGPTLVVLDNCEHLLDGVADVVTMLLRGCPELTILATTREALRVVGEIVVGIDPLATDRRNPAEPSSPTATVDITPAARLFFDRADPIERTLEQDTESRRLVEEICRRLDGVPLALELAAAVAQTTPLAEIADHLADHRFELLTSGPRGAMAHHRTLAAVVDWSFDRLEVEEQRFFASIAILPGSFDAAAAAAVADFDGITTRRLLGSLVSKSMVDTITSAQGVQRYRLLETLREYGLRQLEAQERHAGVEARFLAHFVEIAKHAIQDPSTTVIEWFERLAPDIANLRLAIRRAMETMAVDEALAMIEAFHWYYNYVGSLAETEAWLRGLVGEGQDGDLSSLDLSAEHRAMAYTSLASLANLRGSYRETGHWAELAVDAAREHGDVQRRMAALVVRGATAVFENRQDVAIAALAESLELSSELGDRWARAAALTFMAVGARRSADEQRRADPSSDWMTRLIDIGQQFERAYELFDQAGDDRGMALVLINLGRIEEQKNDIARAIALCDRGLVLTENLGDPMVSALARLFRGRMAVENGNHPYAVECFTQALVHCESLERPRVQFSSACEWLGIIAARHGDIEPLARIAAATEVYRQAPRTAAALPELYGERDRVRAELGDDRFAELEDDGRAMPIDAVKALAIRAATAAVGPTPLD